MFSTVQKQGRGLSVLLAVMAIALAGCSSGSKASPTGTQLSGTSPAVTDNGSSATDNGSGISGAVTAFSSINSYKFSMTLAGGTWGQMLSSLGGAGATGGGAFTVSGMVTVKPDKASDIQMSGFHIIEVGGFSYLDMGTGGFIKSPASGSSMADGFSPETMFSSYADASDSSGYSKVGSEPKNGVDTDHYQATDTALSRYGSLLGVANATWTMDIWIAKAGGYPVSMAMVAKASDNSLAYEILFDITNVNDPTIKISAPTNIAGA
jgi:hypothetical protein